MYDTIIIGAGAAGLAAARMLHDAGKTVLILEAQNRIGGRMFSDSSFADFPVELGAEFIHGENVATHRLLKEYGFSTTDAPRYKGMWWAWDSIAQARANLPEEARKLLAELDEAYRLLATDGINARPYNDMSLGDYLRQKGFDNEAIAYADIYFCQTCCASIESLSIADLAQEMRHDRAGKEEFRVKGGYSAFLAKYSEGLEIQLNEPVNRIEQGETIVVHTDKGRYEAKRVLITVSLSVLQRGLIEFSPMLSPEKQAAIQAMKMERGTKLIYRFDKPYWDEGMIFLLHRGKAPRWWTNGNLISCYATVKAAEYLDSLPEEEALAIGLQELSQMLNQPDLTQHCLAAKRFSWVNEHYVGGGYAHVPAGAAEARLHLAKPEGRLFFAGEATAYHGNPQTVHGALESGWRAAKEILAVLE